MPFVATVTDVLTSAGFWSSELPCLDGLVGRSEPYHRNHQGVEKLTRPCTYSVVGEVVMRYSLL